MIVLTCPVCKQKWFGHETEQDDPVCMKCQNRWNRRSSRLVENADESRKWVNKQVAKAMGEAE